MARVRYLGGEPATVPELGGRIVQPDEIVEVPDERYTAYVMQSTLWEGIEPPAGWEPPPSQQEEPVEDPPEKPAARKSSARAQREG
ncbi:hypothetical protein ABZ508_02570 [Streptomyces lavendulocolor]|uniref:Uncharacterized protein n=1 Tax=Streptomyces lavendulocolor TaxID=67316 RepID=A0ABV2VY84_9ACTN